MDNCDFVNHYDQIYSPDCPSLDELTKPRYSLISPGETTTTTTFQRSLSSSESYTSSYPNPILAHKRNPDCTTSSNIGADPSHDELSEIFDRPAKQIKSTSYSSSTTQATSYYANLISFANSARKRTDEASQVKHEEMNADIVSRNGIHSYYAPKETKRSATLAKDHVIAERKRREKLNEKFIALSAIVPGLKKLDKASVIGDAIKYLKQLEEHVKLLEEQVKRKPAESVYKSQLLSQGDDDSSSTCDGNSEGSCISEGMPQIEARVVDKDVLIRIHSKKKNGFLVKLLMELQKVHLTVLNSSVLPFGDYAMDITIVAQMDDEYSMTVEDLATSLRLATS